MKLLITLPYGTKLVLPTSAIVEVEQWATVKQIGYTSKYARCVDEGERVGIEILPDEALALTEEQAQENFRAAFEEEQRSAAQARNEKWQLHSELAEMKKKLEALTPNKKEEDLL